MQASSLPTGFDLNLPRILTLLGLPLLLLTGCFTTTQDRTPVSPAGPSVWMSRYEIHIPVPPYSPVDPDTAKEKLMQRETALRNAVAQFGAVLVGKVKMIDYAHDEEGNIKPNAVWSIIVDVEGDENGERGRELRKKIEDAFGSPADIWIVRYPIQKILN